MAFRVKVLCVGKMGGGAIATIIADYLKRFIWQIDVEEIISKKMSNNDLQKQHEADLILAALPRDFKVIVLDERGYNDSSLELAHFISKLQIQGYHGLCFVIGGADGLHETIRLKADRVVSFGRVTWPHKIMRMLLLEQLYRVQQIIAGHPYHRD